MQTAKNLAIVVAESDNDMQRLYNLYLKNLGIREDRIIVAESGKKCVEIFENRNKKQIEIEKEEQQPIDDDDMIVILEMHLKDISSVHVAKEIKKKELSKQRDYWGECVV